MLEQSLVVARKEIVDHIREVRSLWASVAHLLMGPVVVSLVMFAMRNSSHAKDGGPLVGMTSIFLLVAAFLGGMNVAMDVLAGERERKSLMPLLLNPVPRVSVVVGKWLAVSAFAAAGVVLTLIAFAIPFMATGTQMPLFAVRELLCWGALGLLPLCGLASALQLTISTLCRTAKEAQTYLSLLIFIPMGIAMGIVFAAPHPPIWTFFIPIAGQQALATAGDRLPMLTPILLFTTAACTVVALRCCAGLLRRDEIVYGR